MRNPFFAIIVIGLATPLSAQDVVFSENFENGELAPGWFWTGNTPQFAAGENSTWSITKESRDLCVPPLEGAWGLALLFHPLPYSAQTYYSLSASVRTDHALDGSADAELGLGWLDTTGGYGFYYGDANSSAPDWTTVQLAPMLIGPGFPGSQFGLVLHLDPSSALAHGFFDNIKIIASKGSHLGIDEAEGAAVMVGPNPVRDVLTITYAAERRPTAIELLDEQGRSVVSLSAPTADHTTLELGAVMNGVYMLRVTSDEQVWTQRVVKQ